MNHYQVVVIGAGIGGLSAAAYLTKAGVETLVIEQTPFPGGRCYSRVINGVEYDIGALYIGDRVPSILEGVFGIDCRFRSYRMGIRIGDHFVSVPFDRRTLRELRQYQIPWTDILCFLAKVPRLYQQSYFDSHQSVGEVLESLTSNDVIRQMGYALFGVSGISPYRLPSRYLGMGRSAVGVISGNPVRFPGGNRQVADMLVDFVCRHNGQIVFEEKVEQIVFKDTLARGIATDRGEYTADFVISNADIKSTILSMTNRETWCEAYLAEIKALKRPLQVVNIFLTISPSQEFLSGFGVFFMPQDTIKEFELLESGQFLDRSMFILSVPTNLEEDVAMCHRATLQFYYPRGSVIPEALNRQVGRVMTDGLNRLFPGLSERVINYVVYDPARYEREFGFRPFVFGVSPDLDNRRFPRQTPVSNFFCVGDSVHPEMPSVPQAMESGIRCAREILGQITGD